MTSLPPSECCAKVAYQQGTPSGHIEIISTLKCYVSSNYTTNSDKYLLIFTDVFGIELLNNKLLGDHFAQQLGYPVIIPDILFDDPLSEGSTDFQRFFANHPVDKTKKCVFNFLSSFKDTFPHATFIAGIGYCFGAKYLCHHLTESGIIDVENDPVFTRESRVKSEEILKCLNIPYQIDLFGGVYHGFAVRGDLSKKQVKYASEKAFSDAVYWFKYHAEN
ncbi:unnamed protein product [Pichia kudriavzevii]